MIRESTSEKEKREQSGGKRMGPHITRDGTSERSVAFLQLWSGLELCPALPKPYWFVKSMKILSTGLRGLMLSMLAICRTTLEETQTLLRLDNG